jgi:hypothetical protein
MVPKPVVGCLLTSDGKFYANKAAAQHANATPVAMVIFVGGKNQFVEDNDELKYNALAMSLTYVKNSQGQEMIEWSNQEAEGSNCGYDPVKHGDDKNKHLVDPLDIKYYYDGIAVTE